VFYPSRHRVLSIIVLTTLVGSLGLAVIDPVQRRQFMSIANTSLGAYWALQGARETDDDD